MSVCSRSITINFYNGVGHSLQEFPIIIVYTIIQMADNIMNISHMKELYIERQYNKQYNDNIMNDSLYLKETTRLMSR